MACALDNGVYQQAAPDCNFAFEPFVNMWTEADDDPINDPDDDPPADDDLPLNPPEPEELAILNNGDDRDSSDDESSVDSTCGDDNDDDDQQPPPPSPSDTANDATNRCPTPPATLSKRVNTNPHRASTPNCPRP